VAVSEVVFMELLAGEPTEQEASSLRSSLLEYPVIPLKGVEEYGEAARIYRACRRGGATVRSLTDCLIAVAAIRAGASVLHQDRDFDLIARHTPLEVEQV
jgi:hypothetical protein